jgi:adenylate cyclase
LLDGSVRRAGDRVRVTAVLTEAATGRNIWSQAYDAEVKDIFGVQEDIARRVVGAAAVKLTRFERERVLGKSTETLAAYEYVLRGRETFSYATRESNHEAREMFRRAIDLDPNYAAAYAALGLSLVEGVSSGWTEFVADDLKRAEALAQKALSLDASLTTTYRLLAEIHSMQGHIDLALNDTERALEINPNDAESFSERGGMLMWAGKATEALPWLQGALRLDPTSARADFLIGMTYYFLSRYGEAIEAMSRCLTGNLGYTTQLMGRPVLAASYAQLNRPQDAEQERTTVRGMSPFFDAERFASQFGTPEAREHILDGLTKAGFR